MLFWPVIIIGLAVLALLLSEPSTREVAGDGQVDMRAVYLAVLATALAFFGAARVLLRGGRRTMAHMAVWLGTIAGLATAYVFRDEATIIVHEIRAELMPSAAMSRVSGEAVLGRGWDGHYRATAEVNGVPLKLMIDTGASMVMLPYENAVELGFDPARLDFSVPVTTANGSSAVAPVVLSSIRIGRVAVFNVPAAVAQPGKLKSGLLGMSFLDRLDETSFQGNRLILRQRSGENIEGLGSTLPRN